MATIKLKFRTSSVPETEGTLYYQREFGIRIA